MRCPKCGYISFDNVEKCLKCRKNIAETSRELQGGAYNVAAPLFLMFAADEDEVDVPIGGMEGAVDEDFEVVDPDLDILVEGEEEEDTDIRLELGGDEDDERAPDLDELSGELTEIEAFSEQDDDLSDDDEGIAFNLGELEEGSAGDMLAMDVPDELADLSDLSPPARAEAKAPAPEEPGIDLDFAGMDDDFSPDLQTKPPAPKKETVLSLDMDEDLDFELDLGGLSIHDDNK